MILRRVYGDGQTIELRRSGNGNPPDSPSWMQHTNSSTNWLRLYSGPWRQIHSRSMAEASLYLKASETAQECLAAIFPDGIATWHH